MSIFLGSQLEDVIAPAGAGRRVEVEEGRHRSSSASPRCRSCPRTPPTATGPRRSPSPATSSSSARSARRRPIYWPQTVLNTAVADSLKQLADELDGLTAGDFDGLTTILSGIARAQQAGPVRGQRLLRGVARRGGASAACRTTGPRSTRCRRSRRTRRRRCSASFGVLSERELAARAEINWERYVKVQNIEANAALDIARTMILPAAVRVPRPARRRAGSSKGVAAIARDGRRAGRRARRRDRRARARPARGPRGRLGPGRGAGLRRRRHPRAERAARGRGRARDRRRRRPVAAAQVPRAAVPVLTLAQRPAPRARRAPARPGAPARSRAPSAIRALCWGVPRLPPRPRRAPRPLPQHSGRSFAAGGAISHPRWRGSASSAWPPLEGHLDGRRAAVTITDRRLRATRALPGWPAAGARCPVAGGRWPATGGRPPLGL